MSLTTFYDVACLTPLTGEGKPANEYATKTASTLVEGRKADFATIEQAREVGLRIFGNRCFYVRKFERNAVGLCIKGTLVETWVDGIKSERR